MMDKEFGKKKHGMLPWEQRKEVLEHAPCQMEVAMFLILREKFDRAHPHE
jgi:hypothetical protein